MVVSTSRVDGIDWTQVFRDHYQHVLAVCAAQGIDEDHVIDAWVRLWRTNRTGYTPINLWILAARTHRKNAEWRRRWLDDHAYEIAVSLDAGPVLFARHPDTRDCPVCGQPFTAKARDAAGKFHRYRESCSQSCGSKLGHARRLDSQRGARKHARRGCVYEVVS
jgi:hypothetical protein